MPRSSDPARASDWLAPQGPREGLGHYVEVIRDHRKLILTCIVIVTVVAGVYAKLAAPVLKAESHLLVTPVAGETNLIGLGLITTSGQPHRRRADRLQPRDHLRSRSAGRRAPRAHHRASGLLGGQRRAGRPEQHRRDHRDRVEREAALRRSPMPTRLATVQNRTRILHRLLEAKIPTIKAQVEALPLAPALGPGLARGTAVIAAGAARRARSDALGRVARPAAELAVVAADEAQRDRRRADRADHRLGRRLRPGEPRPARAPRGDAAPNLPTARARADPARTPPGFTQAADASRRTLAGGAGELPHAACRPRRARTHRRHSLDDDHGLDPLGGQVDGRPEPRGDPRLLRAQGDPGRGRPAPPVAGGRAGSACQARQTRHRRGAHGRDLPAGRARAGEAAERQPQRAARRAVGAVSGGRPARRQRRDRPAGRARSPTT